MSFRKKKILQDGEISFRNRKDHLFVYLEGIVFGLDFDMLSMS